MFDLLPFVAMGYAVDYFTNDIMSGPQFIQDFVEFFAWFNCRRIWDFDFPRFLFPSILQGLSEYSWQTLGYKIQHDLRMDATKSLISMNHHTTI